MLLLRSFLCSFVLSLFFLFAGGRVCGRYYTLRLHSPHPCPRCRASAGQDPDARHRAPSPHHTAARATTELWHQVGSEVLLQGRLHGREHGCGYGRWQLSLARSVGARLTGAAGAAATARSKSSDTCTPVCVLSRTAASDAARPRNSWNERWHVRIWMGFPIWGSALTTCRDMAPM